MELLTASHSSYPRIGNGPDEQALRRAITLREQGRGTDEDVRAAEDQLVLLALQDQERAGLDIVTDGLIRWNDPASHLAAMLDGARINGLIRYFDTNFYIRQPVIEEKITRRSPLVLDEFHWAAQRSAKPIKTVLTGPCTLARLSLKEGGEPVDVSSLALAYAEVLGAEVADLAAAGARVIQIDEPCLVKYPSDLALAREALTFVADRKGDAELGLATYFGDAAPLYAQLQELPVDVLILDFTYSENLPQVIETNGSAKPLGLGLIDGRNTRLEDKNLIARRVERILSRVTVEQCYLTTSCGLEYLPRDRALLKLKHLVSIKNLVQVEGR
jgi:5-methyltetrahydropteroyltriglutamate--homocysteine methyltransferase